jgi:hypothetical protein
MASARLAHLALALYPFAYRRRYGEEMAALVEDSGAAPRVVADLLGGALRAHLRPATGVDAELGPDDRLRLGLSSILLCWVVFAAAGLGLYKTTEDRGFSSAGHDHRLLGVAHTAIQVLAVGATLAVLIGAAPLVIAALRQARDRRAVERAAVLAVGSVLAFAAATVGLVLLAQLRPSVSDGLAAAGLVVWTAIGLGCGLCCALAARLGLFAIVVPRDALRVSAACAALVVVGMLGIALATAVYLGALVHDAPGLAGQGNGPLELLSVAASLGIQLAVMAVVLLPAGRSALRLRRAQAR